MSNISFSEDAFKITSGNSRLFNCRDESAKKQKHGCKKERLFAIMDIYKGVTSMANRAFKYRIYPTAEQAVLFAKTFGCCRKVYNLMLADKISSYKKQVLLADRHLHSTRKTILSLRKSTALPLPMCSSICRGP